MPFKSYDELIDMAGEDPKMAKMKVSQAKQSGRPVVSNNNPGYRQAAISKRLAKQTPDAPNSPGDPTRMKDKLKNNDKMYTALRNRMQKKTDQANNDHQEDEIVSKRKRLGY